MQWSNGRMSGYAALARPTGLGLEFGDNVARVFVFHRVGAIAYNVQSNPAIPAADGRRTATARWDQASRTGQMISPWHRFRASYGPGPTRNSNSSRSFGTCSGLPFPGVSAERASRKNRWRLL